MPLVASLNESVPPAAHTLPLPATIAATVGTALTVIDFVAAFIQPLTPVTVYEIVVVPADAPETVPSVPTVAIAPLALDHTPPVVASVNGVDALAHTLLAPVIVPAEG